MSPPHVHQLNGVAERAIRSTYAVAHAVDVLNRTIGPPRSAVSSFEALTGDKPQALTGDKPRSMPIIFPFGCRAFSVKPRQAYSKTRMEPRAWPHYSRSLQHLGSKHPRVVLTSEVYCDESTYPWKPTVAVPNSTVATAVADTGADQPPGISARQPAPRPTPANSMVDQLDTAKPARASRRIERRDDGQPPRTRRGNQHDLLLDSVYSRLLERRSSAAYAAVVASPPCSTFSVTRFFAADVPDGGPPPVRDRELIAGLPNIPPQHQRELVAQAKLLVERTVSLLRAARDAGAEYLLEHPAD
eukprot:2264821-Pleurochrysis_carterae.AAC.5